MITEYEYNDGYEQELENDELDKLSEECINEIDKITSDDIEDFEETVECGIESMISVIQDILHKDYEEVIYDKFDNAYLYIKSKAQDLIEEGI